MSIPHNTIRMSVTIYQAGEQFYFVPLAEQANRFWHGTMPFFQAAADNLSEAVSALAAAKSASHAFIPSDAQMSSWDKSKGKILDTADKLWTVEWRIGGQVIITPHVRFFDVAEVEPAETPIWQSQPEKKKILSDTDSMLEIVQQLQ